MTPKEMCNSCTHENYCMGAYRKDHWCGNHTRKDRKMLRCKDCKNKRYIYNRYGNESIYVQSPCFMCKWNPTDNKDLSAEEVYYDMLRKIVDAPTTLHMKCSVRMLIPIIDRKLRERGL